LKGAKLLPLDPIVCDECEKEGIFPLWECIEIGTITSRKNEIEWEDGDKTEIPEKEYAQFIGLPEGTTFAATVLRSWGRKARGELVSLKLLRIMETPSSKTIESWMKSLEKTK
jgi:hypothetical protein